MISDSIDRPGAINSQKQQRENAEEPSELFKDLKECVQITSNYRSNTKEQTPSKKKIEGTQQASSSLIEIVLRQQELL